MVAEAAARKEPRKPREPSHEAQPPPKTQLPPFGLPSPPAGLPRSEAGEKGRRRRPQPPPYCSPFRGALAHLTAAAAGRQLLSAASNRRGRCAHRLLLQPKQQQQRQREASGGRGLFGFPAPARCCSRGCRLCSRGHLGFLVARLSSAALPRLSRRRLTHRSLGSQAFPPLPADSRGGAGGGSASCPRPPAADGFAPSPALTRKWKLRGKGKEQQRAADDRETRLSEKPPVWEEARS